MFSGPRMKNTQWPNITDRLAISAPIFESHGYCGGPNFSEGEDHLKCLLQREMFWIFKVRPMTRLGDNEEMTTVFFFSVKTYILLLVVKCAFSVLLVFFSFLICFSSRCDVTCDYLIIFIFVSSLLCHLGEDHVP